MIRNQLSGIRHQCPISGLSGKPSAKTGVCISYASLCFLLHALCAIFCFAQSATAQTTAQQFIWDQANTQMMQADTPADFIEAAETYLNLLNKDINNHILFNNLGCALTMGGDYANAQAAFERAERYSGTTLETTTGISAAIARRSGTSSADLPWYRTAFFWHFGLPARLRITTALIGWNLLWTGFLLLILRKRKTEGIVSIILPLSETLIVTGVLICLLFGTSSLFTIFQENQAAAYWRNVDFSSVETMEDI